MTALARPRGLLGLVAGFLVWSSAFVVLYGLHALGCAWGWDARTAGVGSLGSVTLLRLVLVGAWALHLALAAGLLLAARRLARARGDAGRRRLAWSGRSR